MPVPAEWDRQNEIIVVNHVAKASKEYQSVLAGFHKTLPGVQSVRLHRIQNLWLWEKYQHCQERMLLKSPGSATEQQLFHGTRFTTPEDLYRSEYGFDFRLASRNARWGVGTYFTSSAAYSDRYSFKIPDTSHKQILIAKVLTGQSCPWPQQRTLTKPPPKPDVVSSKFVTNVMTVCMGEYQTLTSM